ncbi:MAG: hypothetical protein CMM26_02335 [Rhodospirillaceae bacterium]|nr:hypothetical protein [Rhodospirillaceae bacterium]|tara:strand:- start:407 stop:1510 length:1104 start_codon:yes stop_codon:yes gene_type:complete
MHRINLLTRGFETPNGRAFLFPLVVHRRALAAAGIDIRLLADPDDPRATDCDLLFIESRVFSPRWETEGDGPVLANIASLADRVPITWFDISDSTGWLQSQVLPMVRVYCKAQLLADRTAYTRPQYGNRIWADHYHRTEGVHDAKPAVPRIVEDSAHLDRLRVSWNSGLADYSLHGPARMALRQHIPLDALLRVPTRFTPVDNRRDIPFVCRMGTSYPRESVSHQRRRIAALLDGRRPTDKLGRRAFLAETRRTRLVISPFGFGEITLKDFEAILCGATLLKPDMSHLETWPDLFRDGETIVTHKWDLSDFLKRIEEANDRSDELRVIAGRAQTAYRAALADAGAAERFANRVRDIVNDALTRPAAR